ncbi:hypothetical protein [Kordia zhangzhouensis]|uniref:hypothetical protein n=1 Tax=Kordia zhangzhouensis TaxID=1620405 RepID=UPI00062984DC|nr:hypothetical protein [Kordia zhangzhouensis]
MKYKKQTQYCVWLLLLVITFGYSQSKKRTKKEVFTVNKDITLEINTSHADVEFDTWNKNKVEIEATIEVENATEEEIKAYFKKWNFSAVGNSEKITISSKGSHALFGNVGQFTIAEPIVFEIPELEKLVEVEQLAEIPEFPIHVMESLNDIKFDYEAYQKDGEAYMKKWQKQWKENFDEKKFQEGMEKWKEEFAKTQEKREELLKKYLEKQEDLTKIQEKVEKQAKKYQKQLEKQQRLLVERLEKNKHVQGQVFNLGNGENNLFYIFSGNKKYKVTKKIKIKMPKKAKLKLNVRHGEVTMAAVSENLNAKLSHAALYANVIDGAHTTIESSYAPIHVTTWNRGALKVNFVENVDLQLVNDINLMSNSSKVNVGTLGEKGIISGTFGNLLIHNIGENFSTLDIILENTDARIQLPKTAFKLYYIGSSSEISYPETVKGIENKTQFNTIVRGYQTNSQTDKEININAKYSDVMLQRKS